MKPSAKAVAFTLVAVACFIFSNIPARADTIYVSSDRTGRIVELDSSGNESIFSSSDPWQIAMDGRGHLYGTGGNQVYKFDSSGNASLFGSLSSGNDFKGLAFDPSGNLFVADWYNGGKIVKFDSNGIGSVYLSGLPEPINVAFDSSGNLYVANWYGGIQKFSSSGQYLSTWGAGLPSAFGLAFDSNRNLYVSLVNNGMIVRFDPSGNQTTFASGLNYPFGLAFDSSGNLCVANWNFSGGSVVKIDPSGHQTTFASVDGAIGIAIQVPEPATWSLLVLGAATLLGSRRHRART